MATLILDTHDFISTLTDAGVPESQAEAIAVALSKATLDQVATKQDISDLRLEIRDVRIDFLKWVIPILLGQIVAFSAIVKWLVG